MTEFQGYWLIQKQSSGYSVRRVEEKIFVHFDEEKTTIRLKDCSDPIHVRVVTNSMEPEDRANFDISPDWINGEIIAASWIDLTGGRIFSIMDEGTVTLLYNVLLAKLIHDSQIQQRGRGESEPGAD